jgi:hypothetical protein
VSRQSEWQKKQVALGRCRQCGVRVTDERSLCMWHRTGGLDYPVGMSLEASRACAHWLQTCLKIGWPRQSLDRLQRIWWTFHDARGKLVGQQREGNDGSAMLGSR